MTSFVHFYKLQRTFNSMVEIKLCWFYSKLFTFGQKWRMSVFGHTLFCPFWANWAEIFYGSSGDYNLSIGGEKFKLRCLFFIFRATLGGKMGVSTSHEPDGL